MNEGKASWYAASIRNCQYNKVSRSLTELGVEFYIPDSFRTLLFVHTARQRALSLANSGVLSAKYLIDHSTHSLLEIPDKQMEDFMRVMKESDSECLTPVSYLIGDRVRVISGPLKGVEGDVVESAGESYLSVSVSSLLCARVRIPKSAVTVLSERGGAPRK